MFNFFDPTASATVYCRRPKIFRAKNSATAEGEKCGDSPTLPKTAPGFLCFQLPYSCAIKSGFSIAPTFSLHKNFDIVSVSCIYSISSTYSLSVLTKQQFNSLITPSYSFLQINGYVAIGLLREPSSNRVYSTYHSTLGQ